MLEINTNSKILPIVKTHILADKDGWGFCPSSQTYRSIALWKAISLSYLTNIQVRGHQVNPNRKHKTQNIYET